MFGNFIKKSGILDKEEGRVNLMNLRKQPITVFREAWIWSEAEERLYAKLCIGRTLHLFSGRSRLGDVRVDIEGPTATHKIDLSEGRLPFGDLEFDTMIADPPWPAPKVWHRWLNLLHEIVRVTKQRIIIISQTLMIQLPKPFTLKHVFLVKKISAQIKLVYVWEREEF